MRHKLQSVLVVMLVLGMATLAQAQTKGFVFMASTIGPVDAGIVAVLEDQFEKETGIRVRHVGAGTGATLKMAEKGNIDLVMVHAKALEEKFVADGYGTERIDLMYNDFVLVGPPSDPAKIRGMKTAAEALKAIAARQATFVSRGDKSGTHVAEMVLWEGAGIKPAAPWYVVYEKGTAGNAATLRYVNEKQVYTLIDRATYLSLKKDIKLDILVENDKAMLNFITLIPVNPKKFPRVNHKDAMSFVKWLTNPNKGQKIISTFGKDKYGSPLFFANSKEWRKKKGIKE